ncbi:MAG: GNAT family N-acetyltransferase [Chloroflexota bacterium]
MTLIRQLTTTDVEDFRQLIAVFHAAFENDSPTIASDNTLTQLLSSPHFIVFGVFVDTNLVGGCTAHLLPSYTSDHPELLIYDFAIHPNYHRRGFGTKLIRAIVTFCHNQHIPLFFALAHAEDTHAIEFYRANGATLEDVVNALFAM